MSIKNYLLLIISILCSLSCQKQFEDIYNRLDNLDSKVLTLEEKCTSINSEINALKTIINALQSYNYVTDVAPIKENNIEIGYKISFSKGDVITIYHGEDGIDGEDGHTPVIGVRQDDNGVYYWTIDGEWALASDGTKIPTTGLDGMDGANGEDGRDGADGKDGVDGTDGKDGVTPILKIEEGYWFVSYNNGTDWTKLDKATGENGDSFFSSVHCDTENVYFTLNDGTMITVPMASIDYVRNLRSLTYVPRYSDGKPCVISSSKESSYVDIDFEVSPRNVIPDIITYWSEHANAKAVSTLTKASSFIDLPIISVIGNETEGMITVKISCKNLPDTYFIGEQTISMAMSLTDGNYNVSSGYIPLDKPITRIAHPYDGPLKVIAHRGFWKSNGASQNSLAGLRAAAELGIWGCEVDVWETADDTLIVNHDGAINGVIIESSPYASIKDVTLSNGEVLPTFDQYLNVFKNECQNLVLIVEIKPHTGTEKTIAATRAIIDMIREKKLENQVEYISFSKTACDEVVKYAPTARVAYLESDLSPYECATRGYSSVDYQYATYTTNNTWIDEAHTFGLEVNAWTVNGRADISSMYSLGIDMITTDRPDIIDGIISAL